MGLVGVNLIYGAFTSHQDPAALVRGLMDGLDRRRIEIDMLKFSGPLFTNVDHRLMSLQLVENGFTDAAMFTVGRRRWFSAGEILYNQAGIDRARQFPPGDERGRPLGMLEAAQRQLGTGTTSRSSSWR